VLTGVAQFQRKIHASGSRCAAAKMSQPANLCGELEEKSSCRLQHRESTITYHRIIGNKKKKKEETL
jgi:hypothetical protein